MKIKIMTLIFTGFLTFLLGCGQKKITKSDLIGTWEAEKLNDESITPKGFIFIKMKIMNDSIEITAKMNQFGGDMTTVSKGMWELKDNVMRSKIGENFVESDLKFVEGKLIFMPDPLFKPESVFSSQYVKINR